ncbi:MAG: hypothetical protein M3421_07130 [Bacteroidota bacterium]|nr:hypothetical protein [Bacteroidota bacterium]
MRNIFKFFLLSRLLGGGRSRRGKQGCGCLGTIIIIVVLFFLLRACTGGGNVMPAW